MQTDGQANILNANTSPSAIIESATTESATTKAGASSDIDLDALRAEVAKWQERVPKLALALRERTDELAESREQLRLAKSRPVDESTEPLEVDDARLRARNDLIAELQAKVTEVGEKHRRAAGDLHSANLDVESAREEAAQWQTKWREVTASLDDSVVTASRNSSDLEQAKADWQHQAEETKETHTQALEKLQKDRDSLRVRNANLAETIEFANKQIASLGEDMTMLVSQVKQADEVQATTKADLEHSIHTQAESSQRLKSLEGQLTDRQSSLDDAQACLQGLREEIEVKRVEVEQLQNNFDKSLESSNEKYTTLEESKSEQIEALSQKLEQEDQRYRDAMAAALSEQTQLTDLLDAKDDKQHTLDQEYKELQETLTQEQERAQQQVVGINKELESYKQSSEEWQLELESLQAKQADAQVNDAAQVADHAETVRLQLEQLEALRAVSEGQAAKLEEHGQSTQKREAELLVLRADQERWASVEQDLLEQVNQVAEAGRAKQLELDREIDRLNGCVGQAQDSNNQREDERRDLAVKVQDLEGENSKLKINLDERSALVRELESELSQRAEKRSANEAQQDDDSRQLKEVRHRLATFQEHAESLEAKLTTQQDLMSDLEEELSDAQVSFSAQTKALEQQLRTINSECGSQTDKLSQALLDTEEMRKRNFVLQAELDDVAANPSVASEISEDSSQKRDLEQLLRERTKELDQFRWREKQADSAPDDNVVMILNQQLTDVRDENIRLRGKLHAQTESQNSNANSNHDLTQLKGVGEKVAQQLSDVGVSTLQDVVELDEQAMRDEEHPMHGFLARMLRDDWVAQAKSLLQN